MKKETFNKMNLPQKTVEKLLRKIDGLKNAKSFTLRKNACWKWKGIIDKYGRPIFRLNGKYVPAKNVIFEYYYGAIDEGKVVFHKCKNKECMDPNHMYQDYCFIKNTVKRGKYNGARSFNSSNMVTVNERDILYIFNGLKTNRIKALSDCGKKLNIYDSILIDYLYNDNWQYISQYYTNAEFKLYRERIVPAEYRPDRRINFAEYCADKNICYNCMGDMKAHDFLQKICLKCGFDLNKLDVLFNNYEENRFFNLDRKNKFIKVYSEYAKLNV
jgi:hypothetical protein